MILQNNNCEQHTIKNYTTNHTSLLSFFPQMWEQADVYNFIYE